MISLRFVCRDPESAWTKLNARTLSEPLPHWITNVLRRPGSRVERQLIRFFCSSSNRAVNRLFTGAGADLGVGQEDGGGRCAGAGTVRCRREPRAQPRRHGSASTGLTTIPVPKRSSKVTSFPLLWPIMTNYRWLIYKNNKTKFTWQCLSKVAIFKGFSVIFPRISRTMVSII